MFVLFIQCKTAWQLVNRKADFLQNESIRIDSHNESNGIDSNYCELECSTVHWQFAVAKLHNAEITHLTLHAHLGDSQSSQSYYFTRPNRIQNLKSLA